MGRDLLELPGSGETLAGSQNVLVLRVNGPYSTNNSFGLIGLVTFCLIWFLRSASAQKMPRWQRVLNALGMTASFIAALLPLFRSIFLTIVLILVLDLFRRLTFKQRALRVGVLALMGSAVLAVMLSVPQLSEERVSESRNIYARIAQQRQNLQMFFDHPVLGVGLNNFHNAAVRSTAARFSYDEEIALDYPHSNLGAVLAETGITGFVPFVCSQVLLVVAFWRLRRSGLADGKLVWIFFIYVCLSYWVSGLALTSGYYSDLNLWYMFTLAVLYKYAITRKEEANVVAS
jgi:O-antigen ligase